MTTLSSRERVLSAINSGQFDRVPKGELCINDSVIQSTLGCQQVGFAEQYSFVSSLGLDIISLTPICREIKEGLPAQEDYLWPNLKEWTNSSLFTFGLIDGAFESGMRLIGFEKFFVLLKKAVADLEDFIVSIEKFNIAMIKGLAEKGIDGIILADDVAYPKGLMANPKTLREHFLPSLERQVEVITKLGLKAFYHSDGNYREIIKDLINVGFVGLHCIDHNSGMDIVELQQKYGDTLCLWGHLDVSEVNKAGESSFLKEIVGRIETVSDNKKIIVGTNSGLFDGMNIDNLRNIYQSV